MKKQTRIKEVDIYKIYKVVALFFFLFLGPLILFKPAYDYTLIKNITGYVFCILLSVLFIIEKKEFTIETKIFIILLCFFIYLVFSSFIAPFGYAAARSLEDYLLYLLIFLVALNIRLEKQDVYFWFAAGFIASVVALCNFIGPGRYVISTFGNPNFFAGHILMLLPLALAFSFIKDDKRSAKLIFLVCAVLFFFSILATKSRAAILAAVFGISTLIFLNCKGNFLKRYSGYIILFLTSALFYSRFYHWLIKNIRWYIWGGTLKMIKVKPIIGWGLGNFPFFYPYYRLREYFLQIESTPVTTQVHNEYLHIWVETGLVGLLLFLGLIFVVIISAYISYTNKNEKRGFDIMLLNGCIAGIMSVLVDNIFSTNLRNPSTAMYFWFLLGISAGYIRDKIQFRFSMSRYLWYITAMAAFVMCVFTSFYRVLPEVYFKRGVWAKDAGDLKEAIDNYLIVCAINPYNYEAWYKMAFAYGESGYINKAEEIYLKINNHLFPHYAKTDANLGTLYMRKGDYKKAIYYYKWAEWFNPYDIDVLCTISSIDIMFLNNIPEALSYLRKVLTIDPENEYANRVIDLLKKEGKI
ncbi:MAG: O-antigen ligase family protein [Candidatus Ratteibacteria bacterium]|nr:O-antigen ligase family protein [Candidatus Ratteibacteria bacterium]